MAAEGVVFRALYIGNHRVPAEFILDNQEVTHACKIESSAKSGRRGSRG